MSSVASGIAALALAAGSSVSAQETQSGLTSEQREERSRLLPTPRTQTSNGVVVPPPPVIMATPITPPQPRAPEPEQVPDPAPPERIAELVDLCHEVVDGNGKLDTSPLFATGWGYEQPRPFASGELAGQMVQYSNDQEDTLALIDLGSLVICRVIVRVTSEEDVPAIRTELARLVSGRSIDQSGFPPDYVARIKSFGVGENFMVTDTHTLELTSGTRDIRGTGLVGADFLTFLMVESIPIPPQFKQRN